MGGKQSIPKITPQDRAILEYVSSEYFIVHELIYASSLKLQRDKLKQYQRKVRQLQAQTSPI